MDIISLITSGILLDIPVINPSFNNIIGQLVEWIHSLTPSYGVAVIVFTLVLKVLTLPLDFWQRYGMKKNSLLQKKLKPYTDKIDRDNSDNPNKAAQEKQALMKKYGYSMLSGCLPMLLMMVIFFVMFDGFRAYSNYSSLLVYDKLVAEYNISFNEKLPIDDVNIFKEQLASYDNQILTVKGQISELQNSLLTATDDEKIIINEQISSFTENLTLLEESRKDIFDEKNIRENEAASFAAEQVGKLFDIERESFLWVKNIYRADSSQKVFPTYTETLSLLTTEQKAKVSEDEYNLIYNAVLDKSEAGKGYFSSNWNGLLILPILSIVFAFVSSLISQRLNRSKGEELDPQAKKTNRTMMFITPLMLALFVFSYTAAFAIYMVSNSILSIIIGFAITPLINKMASKKVETDFLSREPSYSRNKKEK